MTETEASTPPQRSAWARFFETSSGATLITVVIGGIFGTIITAMVQNIVKTHEESRAQAREVVAARLATVQNAFSLVGRMMGTAEDLIIVGGPEYDLSRFEGEERSRVTQQIHTILDDYNETDRQWRISKDSHGLLLAYYHPERKQVPERWTALARAVTGYVDCARGWKIAHPQPAEHEGICDAPRSAVDAEIARFAEAIGAAGP